MLAGSGAIRRTEVCGGDVKEERGSVRFWRNGRLTEVNGFHPRTTLLDYLRLSERQTGTKEGCAEGDCGACTVALGRVRDGRLVYESMNACILLLGQVDGADLLTVENLAAGGSLHPVQQAMVDHHGSQCGFCTPGIVMSLFTLHREAPRPITREAVNDALAGNLCRCTGYRPIVGAALAAFADGPEALPADALLEEMAAVWEQDVFVPHQKGFFAAPASEDSLAGLLVGHPDATIVSGSTDVGLWITKGLAPLSKIVWLGRVQGLDTVENRPDRLSLGATVTHATAFPFLAEIDPDLGELMRRFGSVQVRASGTVGGNIANGSPIGDLAPAFLALGCRLELRRGVTRRSIPLEDFFIAYRQQDRQPGEFLRRIEIDKLSSGEAFRCFKVAKRFDEDISAVMGAFKFSLDGRRIAASRIAYGGMAGVPKRGTATERAIAGLSLDEPSRWHAVEAALAEDFQPMSDHRASAEYRSAVARNLLRKALMEIAAGDTSATRIIGHRTVLQAAE
jgi:xanthine dehydrogenase small subunit